MSAIVPFIPHIISAVGVGISAAGAAGAFSPDIPEPAELGDEEAGRRRSAMRRQQALALGREDTILNPTGVGTRGLGTPLTLIGSPGGGGSGLA